MLARLNRQSRELLEELIIARLSAVKIDDKVKDSFNKIKFNDSEHENNINSHITEVEIYAYAAGLKDGMRFALELTV